MIRRLAPLTLILLAFAFAGCGSKGPLVLPDQPTAKKKKAHPPQTVPAPTTGPSVPISDDDSSQGG